MVSLPLVSSHPRHPNRRRPALTRWVAIWVIIMTCWLAFAPSAAGGVAHAQQDDARCFPETGYCISGRIRDFWEQNDGLTVFGYPITEQYQEIIEGQPVQVQWFERNRLELHPEFDPPYDVLLGRLGVDALEQQGVNWFTFDKGEPVTGCRYFAETEHTVCDDFLQAWNSNGLELDGVAGSSEAESLALFGMPISEPRPEILDGEEYTVQWFERARFELHPENLPPYNVLFGLLGKELVEEGGGEPRMTAPTTPIDVGELRNYTHPDGMFSVNVPNNWNLEDRSDDDMTLINFVAPQENGLISVMVIPAEGPRRTTGELGSLLQQSIQQGFAERGDVVVHEPELQPDGSVRVSFTYDERIDDTMVSLLGNSFIQQDADLVSILWVIVPEDQFADLQETTNAIINSYQVHSSAP